MTNDNLDEKESKPLGDSYKVDTGIKDELPGLSSGFYHDVEPKPLTRWRKVKKWLRESKAGQFYYRVKYTWQYFKDYPYNDEY